MGDTARICQFFLRGRCQRQKCEFRHPADLDKEKEKRPNGNDRPSTATDRETCKFFLSSGCKFGANCHFKHVGRERRRSRSRSRERRHRSESEDERRADSSDDEQERKKERRRRDEKDKAGMDPPSEAVSGEVNAEGIEQQIGDETTATGNGQVEDQSLNQTEDTIYLPSTKRKVLNLAPPEEVPKNFADYLSDSEGDESLVKTPIPTSVIQSVPKQDNPGLEEASVENPPVILNPKSLEESVPGPVQDAVTGGPGEQSATPPTDAISDEPEEAEAQPAPEQILNLQPPSEELPAELLDTEQQQEQAFTVADLIEEEENIKEDDSVDKEEPASADTEEPSTEEIESESDSPMEEVAVAQNPKAKKSQAVKAAELEQDWDDEGGDNLPETVEDSTPKPVASKSEPKGKMEPEFTPRKSSRAPKPTEKKLESENQKNLNTDEMEESVDAIAKELEKSDSEVKKSGKKEKSPKKGKKQQTGENKEDWVTLIFGENGEKVTEKGTPKSKQAKSEDNKTEEEEMGPEAEEFLLDQTPFFSKKTKDSTVKKGGRPRKKDLDEKMDGVAKMGSNMYFYTGPGGGDSPPSLHSDDEDLPVKNKQQQEVEGARKSGRAGKGRNPRLEREDEVVDIPQVKAPPKPNLNPSWLKNHDGKPVSTPVASKSKPVTSTPAPPKAVSTPVAAKAVSTPVVAKAVSTPAPAAAVASPPATPVAAVIQPARGRSSVKGSDRASRVSTDSQEKTEPEASPPRDEALPEFDPAKFTPGYVPKTVKKGQDEYMIVVSGVQDTGLCGGYWGSTENLGSRRRSKPPEALQIGQTEKTSSRRGSVGSVGSSVDTPSNKKTPKAKTLAAATPQNKSNKKQVTKPEKRVESMDSSQSESEAEKEQNTNKSVRGRKRKNEETPPASQEKKAKTSKKEAAQATKEEEEEEDLKASFSDYDSGANETQPLRTTKRPSAKTTPDSPAKDAPLTSKQQTAVSAALAAGVPAGQQRSVSCVADTSTQREVVVECFAPYDDHRWVNIGKERDGMAPDAVQYARALRPPYHLLSFLRIKGHSTKGMSCTDKNTMVFVVLEGEITVILHTTQFNAKKGDSFYIPPKNYYNLINQKAREAELSLIQFQYDGPLPTVQPNSG
eukprot:GFUD01039530.1.p1 GENE.GFUD01039530.1~~GFUD01039530.1.p1  ORF type:complete len:1126 (-),score=436.20 GFUD01039530.1:24-3401(-)